MVAFNSDIFRMNKWKKIILHVNPEHVQIAVSKVSQSFFLYLIVYLSISVLLVWFGSEPLTKRKTKETWNLLHPHSPRLYLKTNFMFFSKKLLELLAAKSRHVTVICDVCFFNLHYFPFRHVAEFISLCVASLRRQISGLENVRIVKNYGLIIRG